MTALNCPECGVLFERPAIGRSNRQRFCTKAHAAHFYNVQSKRGRVAMSLVSTWMRGRRGKSPTVTFALQNLARLESIWAAEDKAAGRNPALIVEDKRRLGWDAADSGRAKRGAVD